MRGFPLSVLLPDEILEEYIQNLSAFKGYLETDNFEEIHKEMTNTNHIKDILKGIA